MKNIYKTLTTLTFVLGLYFPFSAYSCGNEYEEDYTKLTGNHEKLIHDYDYVSNYHFNHGFDRQDLLSRKSGLEEKLKENPFYKTRSDYALLLLKLGEYKKGLIILEDLVKKYPNEYNIVVNLGTAYELNGRPDFALKYIAKAVRLNPESHEGSEWIHIEILKTVLNIQKDKNYLRQNSVLNLGIPGNLTAYQLKLNDEEIKKLISIKGHIYWQLQERMAFVNPPNAIVADLLYDLANLIAITESIERALPVYNESLKYIPVNFDLVIERRDDLKEILYWTNFRKYFCLAIAGGLIAFAVMFILKRRRRSKMLVTAKKPSV
jgi:tetratricopeptide (TPR) repeat protein